MRPRYMVLNLMPTLGQSMFYPTAQQAYEDRVATPESLEYARKVGDEEMARYFEQQLQEQQASEPMTPSQPNTVLFDISRIGSDLHDLRALMAGVFQHLTEFEWLAQNAKENGDESMRLRYRIMAHNLDDEMAVYDSQISDLRKKAETMAWLLPEDKQKLVRDIISGVVYDPYAGSYSGLRGRTIGVRGLSQTTPCRATKEGGKVCADGTYLAPGATALILASEAPSRTPVIPIIIGAAAVAGAIWFVFLRK